MSAIKLNNSVQALQKNILACCSKSRMDDLNVGEVVASMNCSQQVLGRTCHIPNFCSKFGYFSLLPTALNWKQFDGSFGGVPFFSKIDFALTAKVGLDSRLQMWSHFGQENLLSM